MQVILTKDVDTLGTSGDVVAVSDGYARNYLFPKHMAIEATDGAMADLNRRIERIRAKAEKKYQDDLARAEKINSLEVITLEANAGDSGKLFGTITTKELTKVLAEKTGLELERKNVNVDNPINRVGEYTVHVKLSARVSAEVKVVVNPIATSQEEFILEEAFANEPVEEEVSEAEAPEIAEE